MYKLTCMYADGDKVVTYHGSKTEANNKAMQMLRLGATSAAVS